MGPSLTHGGKAGVFPLCLSLHIIFFNIKLMSDILGPVTRNEVAEKNDIIN